jgi:aconitate hydratase
VVVTKPDGSRSSFSANNTMSPEQIEWFKAGSAVNIIRKQMNPAG